MKKSDDPKWSKRREGDSAEVKKMLEQMEQPMERVHSVDVEQELARFKKGAGVGFFDLLKDKQLRAQVRVNDANKRDTDEDTLEFQERYEPHLRQLCQDNNE